MRKLIIVALTCLVFGGCIGALATAATESQASPRAVAAAVQRVQDGQAEYELRNIANSVNSVVGQLRTANTAVGGASFSPVYSEEKNLQLICEHTDPAGIQAGSLACAPPAPK